MKISFYQEGKASNSRLFTQTTTDINLAGEKGHALRINISSLTSSVNYDRQPKFLPKFEGILPILENTPKVPYIDPVTKKEQMNFQETKP